MDSRGEGELVHEVEHFHRLFRDATGGSETITFEQCLQHEEISSWLSQGSLTQENVREYWDSNVDSGLQTMSFELFCTFIDDLENLIDRAPAYDHATTGGDGGAAESFFGSPHGTDATAEEKSNEKKSARRTSFQTEKLPTGTRKCVCVCAWSCMGVHAWRVWDTAVHDSVVI